MKFPFPLQDTMVRTLAPRSLARWYCDKECDFSRGNTLQAWRNHVLEGVELVSSFQGFHILHQRGFDIGPHEWIVADPDGHVVKAVDTLLQAMGVAQKAAKDAKGAA